jgi:hypothetical protein
MNYMRRFADGATKDQRCFPGIKANMVHWVLDYVDGAQLDKIDCIGDTALTGFGGQ